MNKKIQGVYGLYKNEKVVYIGKSSRCILSRIKNHAKVKDFDYAKGYEVKNLADLHILEMFLIGKHNPIYNIDSVTECDPSIEIDQTKLLFNPIYFDIKSEKIIDKVQDDIIRDEYKIDSYREISRLIRNMEEKGLSSQDIFNTINVCKNIKDMRFMSENA